jgi:hypothetical protein
LETSPPRSRWSRWPSPWPSESGPTSSATSRSRSPGSFIQLTAIGYVIKLIFAGDSLVWVALLLAVMVALGAFTAVAGHGSHSTTAAGNLRPAARTGTASGLSEQRADGRLR